MWFTHYEKYQAGTNCTNVPVEQKEKTNQMEEGQTDWVEKATRLMNEFAISSAIYFCINMDIDTGCLVTVGMR